MKRDAFTLPLAFRASMGARIADECVDLLVLIGLANAARDPGDRAALIGYLLERLEVTIFLLRASHEKRLFNGHGIHVLTRVFDEYIKLFNGCKFAESVRCDLSEDFSLFLLVSEVLINVLYKFRIKSRTIYTVIHYHIVIGKHYKSHNFGLPREVNVLHSCVAPEIQVFSQLDDEISDQLPFSWGLSSQLIPTISQNEKGRTESLGQHPGTSDSLKPRFLGFHFNLMTCLNVMLSINYCEACTNSCYSTECLNPGSQLRGITRPESVETWICNVKCKYTKQTTGSRHDYTPNIELKINPHLRTLSLLGHGSAFGKLQTLHNRGTSASSPPMPSSTTAAAASGQWQELGQPMHTVPTKDRMGLVQVVQVVQVPADNLAPELSERARPCAELLHTHLPEPAEMVLVWHAGLWWVLVDITLRMLKPRELFNAQGFPADYVIHEIPDPALLFGPDGHQVANPLDVPRIPLSNTAQVRMCGNSACPHQAEALVRANFGHEALIYGVAA